MAPHRDTGAGAEAERPKYAGHYRLQERLGSGGMGVVHLARSTSGLKLAVKVVHAAYAKDPEFRGRFRQEVAAARRVSGAFTAPVVDADPDAGRPWMATLFIPGPTLAEHVKRNGSMNPAQLRRLMAGLAEALRDIHRVGVVHRDLKPSNVLLAEDGPKVIDFGISRPTDSELRTETGKLIGTPPFMAPEQFRRPREVGPAADVFALGSVLVHAATGRGPFDSDSPYIVAYQVVHDEPDLTGLPDGLAPLVRSCLAKEPEDRPTPDELMRELRSVAASYDTQAFIPAQRTDDSEPRQPPPPAAGRTRGWLRRRPPRRAMVAAGALALALGAALVSLPAPSGGSGTTGTPGPVSAEFRDWTARPRSQAGDAPQCSYGAGRLICGEPGLLFALDPADGSVLWRHPAPDARRNEPPVVAGGLVQPLTGSGRTLEALDPASGRTRWKRTVPAHTAMRQAGDTVLLTAADGTVTGVDAATGTERWNHRIPGQSAPYFSSFPGHPWAYTTSTPADGKDTHVTVVDPDTGEVRRDTRLQGSLKPLAARGDSVWFLSVDRVYGYATAVVRYTPRSGAVRRVSLPVTRDSAHGTVRGSVVYLMAAGGSLDAVDLDTGKRLWSFETSVIRASAPVTDGRQVYVTAPDGRLLAVDARTGRLTGQTAPRMGRSSGQVPGALPEPVVTGGRVFSAAPDGTVFAVDGRDPSAW
jgi:serine/threonine protein kinase/outer membrane protein assembly factor BamB